MAIRVVRGSFHTARQRRVQRPPNMSVGVFYFPAPRSFRNSDKALIADSRKITCRSPSGTVLPREFVRRSALSADPLSTKAEREKDHQERGAHVRGNGGPKRRVADCGQQYEEQFDSQGQCHVRLQNT